MTSPEETQKGKIEWFIENPTESRVLPARTRTILENYSNIPPSEVFPHVVQVRDEAWYVHPWPCVGRFNFLECHLDHMKEYPEVLQRLKDGQTLLDMGCGFGQAIRDLVLNGVPQENLYGCDLESRFIDMGFKLFRDREKLHTKFFAADIFAQDSELTTLQGKIDIVFAALFLHVFGWDDQKRAYKELIKPLKPQSGSMLLGYQLGDEKPAETDRKGGGTGRIYRHNPESFKKMWKEISDEVGLTFTVESHLERFTDKTAPWYLPGAGMFYWTVRRQ